MQERSELQVTNTISYLDTDAEAERIGVAKRKLEELRRMGGGPPFVRIGRRIKYRSDWTDSWAERQRVNSTSEETARNRFKVEGS